MTVLRSFSTRDFIVVFPRMSHKQKDTYLVAEIVSYNALLYLFYYFLNYMQDVSCGSTVYIVFHPMKLITPLYLLTLWYIIIKNALT